MGVWRNRPILTGLVNPKCIGLIGPGVVVHIPSFFAELKSLEAEGLSLFPLVVRGMSYNAP